MKTLPSRTLSLSLALASLQLLTPGCSPEAPPPTIAAATAPVRPIVAKVETLPEVKFIDITTPLIGPDGQPRAECFIPGDIHMLPAGYAVWKSVIAPVVVPVEIAFEKSR